MSFATALSASRIVRALRNYIGCSIAKFDTNFDTNRGDIRRYTAVVGLSRH
jgi:hypothetical protein